MLVTKAVLQAVLRWPLVSLAIRCVAVFFRFRLMQCVGSRQNTGSSQVALGIAYYSVRRGFLLFLSHVVRREPSEHRVKS